MTLLLLWKNQWRQDFPTRYAWIGLCLGLFLETLIYFYTSRAFGENLKSTLGIDGSYFQFVILGELVLWLPMAATTAFAGGVRDAHAIGVFEPALLLPWKPLKIFLVFGSNAILMQLLQQLVLLLFAFVFGFRISIEQIFFLLAFQALALPCFIALGLCLAAIFLRTQRGMNVLGFFTKGSAILAGVYFPTSVFPAWVKETSLFVSPFNALLEGSRLLAAETPVFPWLAALSLLVWSILLWLAAIPLLQGAISAVNKRGSVEMIQAF